jgi:hypothetical protein
MFDIHCPACDRRQLVFPSQITALVNDEQGIVVMYTCWCGAAGAWRTGAAQADAAVAPEHVLAS